MSASNVCCLDNCINRAIYKMFNVGSSECIQDVPHFLGLQELDTMIQERRSTFISRLICDGGLGTLFLAVSLFCVVYVCLCLVCLAAFMRNKLYMFLGNNMYRSFYLHQCV